MELRSRCDGSCGTGLQRGKHDRHHHGEDSEDETIYSARFTVARTSRSKTKCVYISGLLFLLFLVSATAYAVSASNANYMENLSGAEILNRTGDVIQFRRIYEYVLSLPSKWSEDDSQVDDLQRKTAFLKDRLSLVETSVSQLDKSLEPMEKTEDGASDLGALQELYRSLHTRIEKLESSFNSKTGSDVSGKVDEIKDAMERMNLQLADRQAEQTVLREKLDNLLGENEKVQSTLFRLRNNMDSMSEVMKSSESSMQTVQGAFVTPNQVKMLVDSSIAKYDADKTGQTDFALESAGGAVVGIRCTETYTLATRRESLFGVPLWYKWYSPRTVIQPRFAPGECWAFKGSHGFMVLKLADVIRVTGVTYEHISKTISPIGNISSAPRIFEVYALSSEVDEEGVKLGRFRYEDNGPALQSFTVQIDQVPPTQHIELRILSNHGHPVYTCLYRFRVHGVRMETTKANESSDP